MDIPGGRSYKESSFTVAGMLVKGVVIWLLTILVLLTLLYDSKLYVLDHFCCLFGCFSFGNA